MRSKKDEFNWRPVFIGAGIVAVGAGVWLLRDNTSSTMRSKAMEHAEKYQELQLPHQPFSRNRPGVILFVPPGFRSDLPLDLVFYFRGFGSCIKVIAGDVPAPCYPGGRVHQPSQIVSQFRAAKKNAVLVMPEMVVEGATTNAGTFAQEGGFRSFLDEVMHAIGTLLQTSFLQVNSLALYSHSGGWHPLAEVIERSPVAVRDVVLLDSLYGDLDVFTEYAMSAARAGFPAKRFVSIHTGGRPTENTGALARFVNSQLPGSVVQQASAGTPTITDFQHAVYIKASVINHPEVPSFYFGRILQSSYLTNI